MTKMFPLGSISLSLAMMSADHTVCFSPSTMLSEVPSEKSVSSRKVAGSTTSALRMEPIKNEPIRNAASKRHKTVREKEVFFHLTPLLVNCINF
jgi:hypothetical protein